MKPDRRTLIIGVTGSIAAAASLWMATHEPARARTPSGSVAPDFVALDATGVTRSLKDYRGKTVVLEWSNAQCPYVRKHYETGNMQALQRDATAEGVVWFTVISSAPGRQGFVSGAEAQALSRSRGASPTAVLLDPRGSLGRLYGARSTPHMFVIGPDGVLAYQGAIDDRNSTDHATVKGARNYVREALAALAAGHAPAVAATPPYGCPIKYAV